MVESQGSVKVVLVHEWATTLQSSKGKGCFQKDPSLSPLAIYIPNAEPKAGASQVLSEL